MKVIKITVSVKTIRFFVLSSVINHDLRLNSKKAGRLFIMNNNLNYQKCISILEDLLITTLKNQFGVSEVVSMDDNVSCCRIRIVKIFLSENNITQTE